MKKLALVLLVATASVFAVSAEPIGLDVGSEVYISGLAAGDTGLAISPWIGTAKIAIPQVDTLPHARRRRDFDGRFSVSTTSTSRPTSARRSKFPTASR